MELNAVTVAVVIVGVVVVEQLLSKIIILFDRNSNSSAVLVQWTSRCQESIVCRTIQEDDDESPSPQAQSSLFVGLDVTRSGRF